MAIYAQAETSTYELPPTGLQPAVCVDVIDEGFKATQFGEKHKVRFVFQIEEQNSKGYRYTVSAWYNLSMHEKSGLRKFLENWRGRPFSDQELNQPPGFDLETVVGKPATISIVHNETGGKTYANIGTIAPHSARMGQALKPEGYVRKEDREPEQVGAGYAAGQHSGSPSTLTTQRPVVTDTTSENIDEDDIPF